MYPKQHVDMDTFMLASKSMLISNGFPTAARMLHAPSSTQQVAQSTYLNSYWDNREHTNREHTIYK